jgi:ElaB/YqjD/DUF883 family membrane-anchored ribosome-binding protein
MNALDELKESQRRLTEELRSVVQDTQEILQHKVHDASDGYKSARERLEKSLKKAASELKSVEQAVEDGAKKAVRATDQYVHQHPWESIGVSAGIGILLGMLISRK